jgi:P27 family predicted phage terminase small subunit
MKRGRKPKDVALHRAQGTYRPDRHGPARVGSVEIHDFGEPPEHLGEYAVQCWEDLRVMVHSTHAGVSLDRFTVESMAVLWENYREALDHRRRHGPMLYDKKGEKWVRNPAVVTIENSLKELRIQLEAAGISLPGRLRYADNLSDGLHTTQSRWQAFMEMGRELQRQRAEQYGEGST